MTTVDKTRYKSRFDQFRPFQYPLVSGAIAFYATGTSNFLNTYADAAGFAANPNPVPLNQAGTADIWFNPGVGYDVYYYDTTGTLLFTLVNVIGVETGTLNFVPGAATLGNITAIPADPDQIMGVHIDGSIGLLPVVQPLSISGTTLNCATINSQRVNLLTTTITAQTAYLISSSYITTKYNFYELRLTDISVSSSGYIGMQGSTNNGSTFLNHSGSYNQMNVSAAIGGSESPVYQVGNYSTVSSLPITESNQQMIATTNPALNSTVVYFGVGNAGSSYGLSIFVDSATSSAAGSSKYSFYTANAAFSSSVVNSINLLNPSGGTITCNLELWGIN